MRTCHSVSSVAAQIVWLWNWWEDVEIDIFYLRFSRQGVVVIGDNAVHGFVAPAGGGGGGGRGKGCRHIGLYSYSRQVFNYLDPISIYISL